MAKAGCPQCGDNDADLRASQSLALPRHRQLEGVASPHAVKAMGLDRGRGSIGVDGVVLGRAKFRGGTMQQFMGNPSWQSPRLVLIAAGADARNGDEYVGIDNSVGEVAFGPLSRS